MKNVLMVMALLFSCTDYAQTILIHFDFDKYDLRPEAKMSIDSFFSVEHNMLPDSRIHLEGHCDAIGSDAYNDKLSIKRVKQVRKYLETNFPEWTKYLEIAAYGEKRPLNENKTAAERRMNRRVEIALVRIATTVPESPKVVQPGKKNDPTLKEQIADTAIKKGSSIALHHINFEGGRHVFLPEAYSTLQELLDIMNSNPTLVIEIGGHICCVEGDVDAIDADTRTYTLSQERARAVYSYLLSHGIKEERMSYKGYGHSQPIYPFPERNEEERIANRRVEIKIINK